MPPGLYSRDGVLYVGRDTPFMIKGFSWFGLEDSPPMPGGLHKLPMEKIFLFANKYHFNAIRLPLSVENLFANRISHTNPFFNSELSGLTYMHLVRTIVRKAAEHDILVLLDAHRLRSKDVQSKGLWYTKDVKEGQLIEFWRRLCTELGEEWNVLGADLYNEPWDALWNSTSAADDWKRASERLGNTVHAACPSWLVVIEGVGTKAKGTKTGTFWAENLHVMQNSPPRLRLKRKVALSPHVYGPSVYNQTYFDSEEFPGNMPAIWDDHFGHASKTTGLATVIGEWGGKFIGTDKAWQLKFFEYISARKIPFFYWCLNPESADTGGLVKVDWVTPEDGRLAMLDAAPSTRVADHVVHFQYWRGWRVG